MNVLRWIVLLPGVCAAYILASILGDLVLGFTYSEVISAIKSHDGFGGHFLLGPPLAIARGAIPVIASIAASAYIAPTFKIKVSYSIAILSAIFVLGTTALLCLSGVDQYHTFGNIAKLGCTLVGSLVGIPVGLAGVASELDAKSLA